MSGKDRSRDLEETAREQNSTLQSLIEAAGNLLAASRALLTRLHNEAPQDRSTRPDGTPDGGGPAERRMNKPQQRAAATAPSPTIYISYPTKLSR